MLKIKYLLMIILLIFLLSCSVKNQPLKNEQESQSVITEQNSTKNKETLDLPKKSFPIKNKKGTKILTEVPSYLSEAWLCLEEKQVDDLDTQVDDMWKCNVSLSTENGNLIINSTGIPNHDFESGLGCCANENKYHWIIPGNPIITDQLTWAPELGAIAITITGVPIFGPEEGPGGDAVALHYEYFEEDRQPIVIGVCGGHSAGNIYHYHFDANCIHWHEENPDNSNDWKEYDPEKLDSSKHSPIIGFAFDGFPIYGPYGWDKNENIIETTSSYTLKDSENGYNGIDSWEYSEGLGDLDECNGHFFSTPEVPEGIYHYHSTSKNGDGLIGFPYFLLCYKGVVEKSNFNSTANAQGRPPGGNGPNFSEAAKKLGISVEKLKNALGGPPPDFEAAANILEIPLEELLQSVPVR